MKRLLIVLAILLAGAAAFAVPPDISGTLIFAMTSDFKEVHQWYSEAFFNLNKNVTENTAINIQVQAAYKMTGQAVDTPTGTTTLKPFSAYVDDFYMSSAIGKVLKFDPEVLGLNFYAGWYPAVATTYTITNYGYENVAAMDPGSMSTVAAKLTLAKNYNLLAWFSPMGPGPIDYDVNLPRLGANAFGSLGPFSLSAWYYSNGAKIQDGKVGGSAGFAWAGKALSVNADVEAVSPLSVHKAAQYGAAVRVGYTPLIGLIGELMGNSDSIQKLGLEVESTILPQLGICSGVAFDTTGDKPKFDNAEIGGWLKVDAMKFRFGYMLTDTGAAMGSMYTSSVPKNGGVWVKCYLNF